MVTLPMTHNNKGKQAEKVSRAIKAEENSVVSRVLYGEPRRAEASWRTVYRD